MSPEAKEEPLGLSLKAVAWQFCKNCRLLYRLSRQRERYNALRKPLNHYLPVNFTTSSPSSTISIRSFACCTILMGFHKLNASTTDVWAALLSETTNALTERHGKKSKNCKSLVVTRGDYVNKKIHKSITQKC
jgi:hypothetical protein